MDSMLPSIPDLILTQDGSYTLFSKQHGVTYHSKYGALQESNHVFIEAGLKPVIKKKANISILEVGYGTGLNVLLTWKNKLLNNNIINYQAFDIFPLPENILDKCYYRQMLEIPVQIADLILFSKWDINLSVDEGFNLIKHNKDILNENLASDYFDIVYFDAFSPESQPELWSSFIFKKIFDAVCPEGILVTYCAKGEVKRTLKQIGFIIESLPGPPGKREMTRATKPI